jgi:NAD(P)-dependent dehydrogenase (short-subunit alcohol dehydrogenase family)
VVAGESLPWTLHADGVLSAGQPAVDGPDLTRWPPAGATAIELGDAYQQLAARGYGYGPSFHGLRAAWRRGDELFAEVALPEQARADAGRFGVHPALLDAAMHVLSVVDDDPAGDSTMLPFAWSGVSVRSGGASALRVRLSWVATNVARLDLADLSGSPVGTVAALSFRPVSVSQLAAAQPLDGGSVFGVEWSPSELPAAPARSLWRWSAGMPVPSDQAVLLDCTSTPAGALSPAEAVRPLLNQLLADLQAWLAEGSEAPLVVLTRAAVATTGDDPIRPEQAAVWGMVRAAQAENPGRFVLLDIDTEDIDSKGSDTEDAAAVAGVLAAGEPEAALRGGRLRVPRLVRSAGTAADRPLLQPDRTVLVTGGTGGIGALIARHLVTEHGARRLLLVSRRGAEAPGADKLQAELAELGAEVALAAADVGSREDLRRVLDAVPAEHPLGAVVHVAGVVHNGLLGSWTPQLLEEVLAPKADAAWHLHELTRDLDLSAFVLVSSAGGLVLAAGQAGYAAANVFLDALAEHRRREGLPAVSMAYGAWALDTGMSAYLSEADLERMRRQGLPAFSATEALEVFDTAVRTEAAVVVPVKLDLGRLRARADEIPALLRGLARVSGRPAAAVEAEPAGNSAVLRRLQEAAPGDRRAELLTVIRTHAAVVLGVNDPQAIDPDRGFLDMGFDSLSALEMRNRMVAVMGRNLIPMLLFDYPSPAALAAYFEEEMFEKAPRGIDDDLVSADIDELFSILDQELETPG